MSYSIQFTDNLNKGSIEVEDNALNQQTSLAFPGRNYTGYAPVIGKNFLQLLENFASPNEPPRPVEGQIWYDTSSGNNDVKFYDGTNWQPIGGLFKENNRPDVSTARSGDLWVDKQNQQLFLNSGSGWVLVGPTFSDGLSTGSFPVKVTGTDNLEYTVIILDLESDTLAVISSSEFTPKTVIPGFNAIRPGINLANKNPKGGELLKYRGVSESSENLVVNGNLVSSGNFLRSDQTSATRFPFSVQNNEGLRIGTDSAFRFLMEGQTGIIQHSIEGSSVDFRLKENGSLKNVLRVNSSRKIGVNNEVPEANFDVHGDIKTDTKLSINGTEQATVQETGSLTTKGGASVSRNMFVGGNLEVVGNTTLNNLVPDKPNERNIGTSNNKWKDIYATTFRGSVVGNVSGSVSGVASSANELTSITSFSLSGDVSSDEVPFNGQKGGLSKVFNTEISNSFISSKSEVRGTQSDDEILINRVTGDLGLKKVSRKNLLDAVPINPPGSIMAYGGSGSPPGWLVCDGSEYRITDFQELFETIGYNFGPRSTVAAGFFRVPDLRGRQLLGSDNMGGTEANVVEADYAKGVGKEGGTERKIISIENLPEHEHTLKGDQGDQYYILRNISGSPKDPEGIVHDAPTSTGNAQALPNSGGVNSSNLGSSLNTMDPTTTVTYIIFTGRF